MAQWIARSPPKGQVGGSNPPRGTIKIMPIPGTWVTNNRLNKNLLLNFWEETTEFYDLSKPQAPGDAYFFYQKHAKAAFVL